MKATVHHMAPREALQYALDRPYPQSRQKFEQEYVFLRGMVQKVAEDLPAAEAAAYRQGALDMREAAAALAENWKPRLNWDGWKADEVPEYIAIDIRNTLPIPERAPAKERDDGR